MSSAPPASTLTLLSALPTLSRNSPGRKVRFLGCVNGYETRTGILELQHPYPPSSVTAVLAMVDVNLLLETINRDCLEVGTWVNVIGYMENVSEERERKIGRRKEGKRGDEEKGGLGEVVKVEVQAVMLWSAEGIKIPDYELAVEGRVKIVGAGTQTS